MVRLLGAFALAAVLVLPALAARSAAPAAKPGAARTLVFENSGTTFYWDGRPVRSPASIPVVPRSGDGGPAGDVPDLAGRFGSVPFVQREVAAGAAYPEAVMDYGDAMAAGMTLAMQVFATCAPLDPHRAEVLALGTLDTLVFDRASDSTRIDSTHYALALRGAGGTAWTGPYSATLLRTFDGPCLLNARNDRRVGAMAELQAALALPVRKLVLADSLGTAVYFGALADSVARGIEALPRGGTPMRALSRLPDRFLDELRAGRR